MVPYFVWGVISVFFWSLYSHKSPLLRILELPIRPIFVLWFVYSMFLSVIFFWIIHKFLSNKIIMFLCIVMYIVGSIGVKYVDIDSFFRPTIGFFQNFIFMELGSLSNNKIAKNQKKSDLYVIFLVSFFLLIILNKLNIKFVGLNIFVQFFCAFFGTIGICEASKIFSSWKIKNNLLSILGYFSMEIYLIHKIVVEALSVILVKVTSNIILFTILNIILTITICFVTIKVIHLLKLNKFFWGDAVK